MYSQCATSPVRKVHLFNISPNESSGWQCICAKVEANGTYNERSTVTTSTLCIEFCNAEHFFFVLVDKNIFAFGWECSGQFFFWFFVCLWYIYIEFTHSQTHELPQHKCTKQTWFGINGFKHFSQEIVSVRRTFLFFTQRPMFVLYYLYFVWEARYKTK